MAFDESDIPGLLSSSDTESGSHSSSSHHSFSSDENEHDHNLSNPTQSILNLVTETAAADEDESDEDQTLFKNLPRLPRRHVIQKLQLEINLQDYCSALLDSTKSELDLAHTLADIELYKYLVSPESSHSRPPWATKKYIQKFRHHLPSSTDLDLFTRWPIPITHVPKPSETLSDCTDLSNVVIPMPINASASDSNENPTEKDLARFFQQPHTNRIEASTSKLERTQGRSKKRNESKWNRDIPFDRDSSTLGIINDILLSMAQSTEKSAFPAQSIWQQRKRRLPAVTWRAPMQDPPIDHKYILNLVNSDSRTKKYYPMLKKRLQCIYGDL